MILGIHIWHSNSWIRALNTLILSLSASACDPVSFLYLPSLSISRVNCPTATMSSFCIHQLLVSLAETWGRWPVKCFQYLECWSGNNKNALYRYVSGLMSSLVATWIWMAGNILHIFKRVSCLHADHLILWNFPNLAKAMPFSSHMTFSCAIRFAPPFFK